MWIAWSEGNVQDAAPANLIAENGGILSASSMNPLSEIGQRKKSWCTDACMQGGDSSPFVDLVLHDAGCYPL